MKYTAPKGCKDIYAEEANIFRFLEEKFINVCQLYNYSEIKTPIFENAELFLRSLGEETEVITKQMYLFKDKAERELALRPEGTAGVVRAYIESNLCKTVSKSKFFYSGQMFRYERPQSGRQRQFHQLGVEYFGEEDILADVEVINLAIDFIKNIGIKNFNLEINSVGCKVCQPKYRTVFKNFIEEKKDLTCDDCKERIEKNVLRILDCKQPQCKELIKTAPPLVNYLCENCSKKYKELKNYLTNLNISFKENYFLIRGLDYYTQTVFEITNNELGAQNAICGGGRYNNLVANLGGPKICGTGFALGVERLILILKSQGNIILVSPQVFVIALNSEAKNIALNILNDLRKNNLSAEFGFNASLKSLLKKANNLKVKYAVIIGEEEIKKEKVILKNMQNGEQKEVDRDLLIDEFQGNYIKEGRG